MWTPDEATAINALMADRNARCQIIGPKAFNRYGYSEQLPALTTLYNDAISGERRVGSVSLKLIKVTRDRLGGVEKVRMNDNRKAGMARHDRLHSWHRRHRRSVDPLTGHGGETTVTRRSSSEAGAHPRRRS